jgi:hypothetical protein
MVFLCAVPWKKFSVLQKNFLFFQRNFLIRHLSRSSGLEQEAIFEIDIKTGEKNVDEDIGNGAGESD